MIAEVDLKPHQCVAELVDNAFDELGKATAADPSLEPRVDVRIPTSGSAARDSEVQVADNGRGMTKAQLEHSLRAGSSGNMRYGALGLFGMGFNVATARLGALTTVRSGRTGDDFWTVVELDLDEMKAQESFKAPVTQEPKDPAEHGTVVSITRLRSDVVARLRSNMEITTIRKNLGRTYTYMLRTVDERISGASAMGGQGMALYVNDKRVNAVWPCVWDPSRSISYRGDIIPAFEQIDIRLTPAWACMECGHWHTMQQDVCTECGSTILVLRERRIWGWTGVQRYIDNSDFGFTFFRQGRSITTRDKSLFEWEEPDGTPLVEYPVELGLGRIVGEIHLDHAPVNFRKTDFDRSSPAWLYMVAKIRGEGPLRQKTADRLGYQHNTSPLGRMFNGYRRNEAGLKHLIPGDGTTALNHQAKQWAVEFANGTPGYESDEKWYLAAKRHTEIKSGHSDSDDTDSDGDDDWFDDQGLGGSTDGSVDTDGQTDSDGDDTDGETDTPEPAPETDEQRFARYKSHAQPLPELDATIRVGTSDVKVRAYLTEGVDLLRDGTLGAPFTIRFTAGVTELFIDARHPLITTYGWSPFDVVVVSAAHDLKTLYQYQGRVDDLILEVMAQFPDQRVDAAALRAHAEALLDQMRETLEPIIAQRPEAYWNALQPTSRQATGEIASRQAPEIDWAASISSGGYAPFLTVGAIRDLLIAYPADLLDRHLFRGTYEGWLDETTRQGAVSRIAVLLEDLSGILASSMPSDARELNRLRLSADILAADLVS